MNILGIIGAAALFPKYKTAKAEYDDLKEKVESIRASVQTYNFRKLDEYIDKTNPEKPNDFPAGLSMAPMFKVGNLVGTLFHCRMEVTISNTSRTPFYVRTIYADPVIFGDALPVFKSSLLDGANVLKQEAVVNRIINSGESVLVDLPSGISGVPDMGKLRDVICKACGRKLITSCWKVNIEDGTAKADVMIDWSEVVDGQPAKEVKRMWVRNYPAILRYMMEAYYPKN